MRLVITLAVLSAVAIMLGLILVVMSTASHVVGRNPASHLTTVGLAVGAVGIAVGLITLLVFAFTRGGRASSPGRSRRAGHRHPAGHRHRAATAQEQDRDRGRAGASKRGSGQPARDSRSRPRREQILNPTTVYSPRGLIDVPRDVRAPGSAGPAGPAGSAGSTGAPGSAGPPQTAQPPGFYGPAGARDGFGMPAAGRAARGEDRPSAGRMGAPPPPPRHQPGAYPAGPGWGPPSPGARPPQPPQPPRQPDGAAAVRARDPGMLTRRATDRRRVRRLRPARERGQAARCRRAARSIPGGSARGRRARPDARRPAPAIPRSQAPATPPQVPLATPRPVVPAMLRPVDAGPHLQELRSQVPQYHQKHHMPASRALQAPRSPQEDREPRPLAGPTERLTAGTRRSSARPITWSHRPAGSGRRIPGARAIQPVPLVPSARRVPRMRTYSSTGTPAPRRTGPPRTGLRGS